MSFMPARQRSSGVTLVEMLTVLVILAILAGIGVPGLQELVRSNRMTVTANELLSSVNLARSEAIKRGARVDLVPAGDGTDWDKGWIVFVDENNDQKPDAGEEIVLFHGAVPQGVHIRFDFSSSNPMGIAYTGTGRTRTNTGSTQFGSFLLEQDGQIRRKLAINILGRARVCNPSTESGC